MLILLVLRYAKYKVVRASSLVALIGSLETTVIGAIGSLETAVIGATVAVDSYAIIRYMNKFILLNF
jgi:hypothetical protein